MTTQKPGSSINTQRPTSINSSKKSLDTRSTSKEQLSGKQGSSTNTSQQFGGNKGTQTGDKSNQGKGITTNKPASGSIWDNSEKRAAEAAKIAAQRSNTTTGNNSRPGSIR
jgi:hypothetical protein